MPYITSVERIARQEGRLQQGRGDVIEMLEVRFGEVPTEISQKINSREGEVQRWVTLFGRNSL